MTNPEPSIHVRVDLSNPGQFFACCGLLELADRLWPGAEAWFADGEFCIACNGTSKQLLMALIESPLDQDDADDDMASPMRLADPFGLELNWWCGENSPGRALKVWAGSMRGVRIARAMKQAMLHAIQADVLFDHAAVAFDPDQPRKKVEPFYFDSRRGRNALALDIGFAPDGLKIRTLAYPAVELLCLVGLQRCRPRITSTRRVFEYTAWRPRLPVLVAPAVVCGVLPSVGSHTYSFESGFRTDQKKHKAFLPATLIGASS